MICKSSMFQNLKNNWKNNCLLKSKNSQYFHVKLMSGKNRFYRQCQTNPRQNVPKTPEEMLKAGGLDNFDAKQIFSVDRK